ncbi:MAG: SprT-like domain-containing protein [Planctomycetes bacterium]|nr:SprT-like domain-containing protein [Planctomycetota bacterium]
MLPHIALDAERDRAFEAVGRALALAGWPPVPVRWNRRLRRAGRAVIHRHGSALRATIELSPAYFEVYPYDLAGILVHEAVHVGLAVAGRPFGHGPVFRRVCLAAGGRLHSRPMPGRVWRYRCPVCEATLERRRRPSGDRWCAACASEASRGGRPPFTRDRALVLVGLRFSAAETADAVPASPPVAGADAIDKASPA